VAGIESWLAGTWIVQATSQTDLGDGYNVTVTPTGRSKSIGQIIHTVDVIGVKEERAVTVKTDDVQAETAKVRIGQENIADGALERE
jgi:hypothetical protein